MNCEPAYESKRELGQTMHWWKHAEVRSASKWSTSRPKRGNWLAAEGNAEKPSIKKTDLTSVFQSSPY